MRAMNLSQRENYKWWVFAAVALGTLTSVINNGSVIVAVPTIAQHFGTDLSTVQWVVIAEGLTVSALLLPMGRLSDIVGRKQVYVAGLIIFILAAALAGMSPNIAALIVFKGMQGIGAAMTQGTGLAMVTSVCPASERGKGIGTHASVVGTGGVIGPVVGGFLVVAPRELVVFPVSYTLDRSVVRALGGGRFEYRLQVIKQSGFDRDSILVTIAQPEGAAVSAVSPPECSPKGSATEFWRSSGLLTKPPIWTTSSMV